jgi:hypothetical protein
VLERHFIKGSVSLRRYVERSNTRRPHKSDAFVFLQMPRICKIDERSQIWVDGRYWLSIQVVILLGAIIERDHGHMDICTFQNPLAVRLSPEDVA